MNIISIFPSPAAYLSFLLTCLDTAELGRETELYQRLSRVYLLRTDPRRLFVLIHCDAEQGRLIEHVSLANGGT